MAKKMEMAISPAKGKRWIVYTVDDKPPLLESIFLGVQQYLTMFGATVLIPILIAGELGMPGRETAILISTIFFCMGITTLLQTTIGNKLPIIQGGSFSFLPPIFVIIGATVGQGMGYEIALQEICGAIIAASFFEIILGYSGLIGKVRKLIGPITIAPTITLIGLSLFGIGAPTAGGNWYVAGITLLALIVYSQFFSIKSRAFLLFPVLLAIFTGWMVCAIGTFTGIIPVGDPAYLSLEAVRTSPWIRPPYPFQWGMPRFTVAFILGMIAAYVASMIESIGDYYAVSRMAEAPVPTEKTINRGLGTEGIGCLITGILGGPVGSTSYSENIGAIGLTRVASRQVFQIGGILMLVFGSIGKIGAIFATIPSPVVGAMYIGLFGMIAAVGLSNLQHVDLNSSRNLFILGFALFMGLSLPAYFQASPVIWAQAQWFADIITTIGSTGMAVSGIFAIILDNIVPGTIEERGLKQWLETSKS